MTTWQNCEGFTRRDCLQLGLGTLLGGGLTGVLRAAAQAPAANVPRRQADSCILIWLDGGPTHYETFDPKPDAPAEIRGEFEAIPTKLPGVCFSQYLPRLASLADRIAVIRSIRHNEGNHGAGNHYMMTGAPPRIPVGCGAFVSFHPSMGSVIASERGAPAGLPAYFSMPGMTRSGGPNFLGAKFAPFIVSDDPNRPDFRVRDVALPRGLTDGQFADRKQLRQEVDRMVRINDPAAGDPVVALDEFYQQGYELVTSPAAQAAFDISREPDAVRDRYGRNGFGQRALLARRLVEAGVPFITLNEGGWDHHRDIFNALRTRLPAFEATIAALIEDLDQRGMLAANDGVGVGRIRPYAASELRPRPRSLVQCHVRAVCRRRHAGGPSRRRDRPQRLRSRGTRAGPGEFCLDGLCQAGDRSRQDPVHAARTAGAPGQRPEADRGIDVTIRFQANSVPNLSHNLSP